MKDPKLRITQILLSLFVISSLLIISSCDDDPEPTPKSSAKSILSFKFSALTPEVTGTISEADKKIALTVPFGTDLSTLSPTITVSEKATVSPASGTAQNFANPVTYTVTAEDGTTQAYTATVTVSDPPASTGKSITSFKFAGFEPEVIGTINESEKTISIMVPNGTDVSDLAPTIEVSEEATVSPASDVSQDFTNPVTYTVTAEDESTQTYDVTVTVDPTVDFTLDTYTGPLEIAQSETLSLSGDNFGDYHNNSIVLIDEFDTEYTLDASASSTDDLLVIEIPSDMPTGTFHIRVQVNGQTFLMEETFTITFHEPVIASVSASVIRGEAITITGDYFEFNTEVSLVMGDNSIGLLVTDVTQTSIVATVPSDIAPGEYTVRVDSHDMIAEGGPVTVEIQPGIPYIESLDKFSYTRGETMVITGVNLKKDGVITHINFLPFTPTEGPTIVRSVSVNAEGTEATFTIPNDFPTGTYSILVEVDFEFSEEYGEIIQIQ
jgi:hypothetical protein